MIKTIPATPAKELIICDRCSATCTNLNFKAQTTIKKTTHNFKLKELDEDKFDGMSGLGSCARYIDEKVYHFCDNCCNHVQAFGVNI